MTLALRFRSAVLLAASAAAGPAFAQALPPGVLPAAGTVVPASGDPFASGGAYAVPVSGPVAVAYADPAASPGATISGPIISGPLPEGAILSGPTTGGGPVYMAPQVIGGSMPGGPGCDCGPGGMPMFDPSMSGTMIGPSYGASVVGPTYGGAMPYGDPNCYGYDDGCCLGSCLASFFGCCDAPGAGYPSYDPCAPVCPPVCDPCQQAYPVCPPVCDPCQTSVGGPHGGIYHGAGGAQRCGWATGFSFVFLRPYYGTNDAFSVTQTGGFGSTTNTRDFDYSLDLSPRVFVEYVGRSDTGLRATWFGFENDADTVSATVPADAFITTPLGQVATAGQSVAATSEIDVDTIDFDLTQRVKVRRSLVNIGGGVRWASFEHDYSAVLDGALASTGDASRQFDGFGPTVFAEWRRPIGMSRFSVLANIRGSMLYGEGETESLTVSDTVLGPVTTTTRSENDDFVAIGETQLGGEWSAWVSRRTVLFVQLAWETQYWLGVGTAFDRNDDLGLFGFNTTVGLEW